jgi:Ricin-type beta-trefoil lectin domain-like
MNLSIGQASQSYNFCSSRVRMCVFFFLVYFSPRFFIISEMNGKVLDVRGGNPGSGAEVIMWPRKPGNEPNQLWYFDSEGVIHSALNDFVLEACSKFMLNVLCVIPVLLPMPYRCVLILRLYCSRVATSFGCSNSSRQKCAYRHKFDNQ